MQIDIKQNNLPNLTKKERREAFRESMNDYNIVNQHTKEVEFLNRISEIV